MQEAYVGRSRQIAFLSRNSSSVAECGFEISSRDPIVTTAFAADIFMHGRWTDSEHATMFGHVACQLTSIYDDSHADRLISLCAAKMDDTPVS